MWRDSTGFQRHEDEEWDVERDTKEAVERQRAIDDFCYSPDPLTQFLNRKRYYDKALKENG
jgi:hypothetical protein